MCAFRTAERVLGVRKGRIAGSSPARGLFPIFFVTFFLNPLYANTLDSVYLRSE